MTTDRRSSRPTSCLWMRPTCNPPSQVAPLPAPVCSLRPQRFGCHLLVSFRAAEGQQRGPVQLTLSPGSVAPVPQRKVPHQPRLLHCAAFQSCRETFFSLFHIFLCSCCLFLEVRTKQVVKCIHLSFFYPLYCYKSSMMWRMIVINSS